ncbi:hypothetical protein [Mycobacterium malmoense]|uniref:hypothetical protein n=1 Tax=Mycobacterium malmoense TaxID=1780 RepID=UPI00113026D9|nr:hypothetical protein [Mycobacterium malmoense]
MTEQTPRAAVGLEAQVARVNSKTQLVLNVGRDHGVKPGDIFRIMSLDGIPINDPKSGEEIGVLPVEKARVSAQTVYPRICVVETYRTYKIGGTNALGVMFGPEKTVKEEMEVERSDDYDVDRTVRVGDTATLISLAK